EGVSQSGNHMYLASYVGIDGQSSFYPSQQTSAVDEYSRVCASGESEADASDWTLHPAQDYMAAHTENQITNALGRAACPMGRPDTRSSGSSRDRKTARGVFETLHRKSEFNPDSGVPCHKAPSINHLRTRPKKATMVEIK